MTTHQLNDSRPSAFRADRLTSSSARQGPGQGVNAKARYVRYVAMARAAAQAGDLVEAENCYQHAEHYFRVMREPPGMEEPPE
jgi:environmental stress-induced protein Ves